MHCGAPEVPNVANRRSLWPIDTVMQVANATTRTKTRMHMAAISKKMSHMAPTRRLIVLLTRMKCTTCGAREAGWRS